MSIQEATAKVAALEEQRQAVVNVIESATKEIQNLDPSATDETFISLTDARQGAQGRLEAVEGRLAEAKAALMAANEAQRSASVPGAEKAFRAAKDAEEAANAAMLALVVRVCTEVREARENVLRAATAAHSARVELARLKGEPTPDNPIGKVWGSPWLRKAIPNTVSGLWEYLEWSHHRALIREEEAPVFNDNHVELAVAGRLRPAHAGRYVRPRASVVEENATTAVVEEPANDA